MSELNRLRELCALLLPKETIAEAKQLSFDGFQASVNSTLNDLEYDLSEGGTLETMIDKAGLSTIAADTLNDIDKLVKKFKSDLEKLMLEAEGLMHSMKESVNEGKESSAKRVMEMAALNKMNSGFFKSREAKELVAAFKAGEETVDLKNGDSYKLAGKVNSGKLAKGDVLFGSYNSSNQGADVFMVLGLSNWDKKYGDGGVHFDSVQDALKDKGATSLKALSALQDDREYGKSVYLIVKELDGPDEWRMYLDEKGRWCRGSGAEPISFVKIEKV